MLAEPTMGRTPPPNRCSPNPEWIELEWAELIVDRIIRGTRL